MISVAVAALTGLVAGVAASAVMNGFQRVTARQFGQDPAPDNPANVQAATDIARIVADRGIRPKADRRRAGTVLHYATGATVGIGYGLLVSWWPPAAALFGVAFGIVLALVLDDLIVPLFGWGDWPWQTDLPTHAYGLTAHAVFGAVLEGVRRLTIALL